MTGLLNITNMSDFENMDHLPSAHDQAISDLDTLSKTIKDLCNSSSAAHNLYHRCVQMSAIINSGINNLGDPNVLPNTHEINQYKNGQSSVNLDLCTNVYKSSILHLIERLQGVEDKLNEFKKSKVFEGMLQSIDELVNLTQTIIKQSNAELASLTP